MKLDKPGEDHKQREGDRASARRYQGHVHEFVAGGKVEPAGRAARGAGAAYVEPFPEDAARAARKARRGQHNARVTIDELVAKGRIAIDRVEALARRVATRFGRRSR